MSKNVVMLYSALGHAYFHMFTAFYFIIVLSLEIEWHQPYHELIKLWSPGAVLVGIFAIFAGWLGDRWSARGMLVVYFFGMGLSAIAAGYANNPLMMLLALSGIGLFASIYHPVGIPLVIRNSGKYQGKALALNGVFGSLGTAMAGVVTGFLVDIGGSFIAFVLPGTIVVLTGVAMLIGLRRTELHTKTEQPKLSGGVHQSKWTPLLVILFCLVASGLVYHSMQTVMPKVFSIRLDPGAVTGVKTVGIYIAVVYGIGGLFQFIGGALADRYSLKWVYLCHFVAYGLLLLLAAQVGGILLVVVMCAAVSFGAGVLPAENMLLARYTSNKHYGLVFGLKFVLFFASGPIAIMLVSVINRQTGQFVGVFLVLAIAVMAICLAALALPRTASKLQTS